MKGIWKGLMGRIQSKKHLVGRDQFGNTYYEMVQAEGKVAY
jgi:NADH:ubiquinone oxidoreductase subunit